jgi:hypothetical protein
MIGVCFKSPTADQNELENLLCAITKATKNLVIIMGNFNFPYKNWTTFDSDVACLVFGYLVLNNYLLQNVLETTRDNNILDLGLRSQEAMVENLNVIKDLVK